MAKRMRYWILDPEQETLEAFELDQGTYRVTTSLAGDAVFEPPLFPGLTIDLAQVWE